MGLSVYIEIINRQRNVCYEIASIRKAAALDFDWIIEARYKVLSFRNQLYPLQEMSKLKMYNRE